MLDGVRILIVDDDPDQNGFYEFAFHSVGAETRAVESVAKARVALERERFDVVVSDVVMPDESGYDLVRWLRSTPGENRVAAAIALTGMVAGHDRDEALAAGFDEHCTKPCSLDELIPIIRRLLGGATARSPRDG